MRLAGLIAGLVGVAGTAAWVLTGGWPGAMPSYLAAWLFWIAAPIGALALVMLLECCSVHAPVMLPLRRSLLLLPLGAVFAIPVVLRTDPLFLRPGVGASLPADWMHPGYLATRMVAILVVLSLLALVFSAPPARGPRRAAACLGLFLHACLVTLAATDWLLALQPGLNSSALGALLIVSQLGIAACLTAFLLAAATKDGPAPGSAGALLATLLAAWVFVQFTQFLVVWSANLPTEIVWYQVRFLGLGLPAIGFAAVASAVAMALLPSGLARIPAVLASLAAMLLVMHLVAMFWLVTPAFRGRFTVTFSDLLAVAGLGGLLVGALLLLLPVREMRFDPA